MSRTVLLFLALLGAVTVAPSQAAPVDLIVVLDNSGSMRSNDPQGLARAAVERMIDTGDFGSRIAIITFDSAVRLEMPLTPILDIGPDDLSRALDGLDYRGQWTDIPGAIERGLYHLQERARPGSNQAILLLTDGIVDTGDAARDRDRESWLLGELADSAKERGVRIFGIAFSDGADFRLIQGLAGNTDAEYLRVLAPEDLVTAFATMQAAMSAPPEPEIVPEPEPEPEPATPVEQRPAAGSEPATQAAQPDPAATPGWRWWHSALLVLVIVGGASGAALFMRHRARSAGGASPPGAVLVDFAEVSGQARLSLPGITAVVGRRAAGDPMSVTNIVIDKHTISRKHATIEWRDGEYWLEDHGSANGTFVDDVQVEGRVQLYDGARIRFDQFVFEFRLAEDDHTVMRGAEEGGDATLVRGGGSGSTTVFDMPPSAGGDFESPEGEDVDFGFGEDSEDPTGPK